MALITLRQMLDHAAEHGYGVPAFNINNMEQGLAILNAAQATDAPVILQASRGARSYAGDVMLRHLVQALAEGAELRHPRLAQAGAAAVGIDREEDRKRGRRYAAAGL